LLPGEPKYVPTSDGMAAWGTAVGGQMAFLTSYVTIPEEPGLTARGRLQQAARQASRQGRVLQRRRLKLAGLEGLELIVEDDEEQVTAYRWYLGDRRFYQLLALVPKRRYGAEDPLLATFFDSFRLLRR
jgi:hypothetical protein